MLKTVGLTFCLNFCFNVRYFGRLLSPALWFLLGLFLDKLTCKLLETFCDQDTGCNILLNCNPLLSRLIQIGNSKLHFTTNVFINEDNLRY